MKRLSTAVLVVLCAWFVLSFVDIVLHNLTTQEYMSWNLFMVLRSVFKL